MSRRNQSTIRKVLPDPIFKSVLITKLINGIMQDGRKAKAEKILYNAFKIIEEKTNKDPMEVFQDAVKNVTPILEVKTRRIGGANYQVPIEVTERRKQTLTLRWIINYAHLRSEYKIEDKLANEIMDAAKGVGASVKKKDDTHRMAEANKAFAHYRW